MQPFSVYSLVYNLKYSLGYSLGRNVARPQYLCIALALAFSGCALSAKDIEKMRDVEKPAKITKNTSKLYTFLDEKDASAEDVNARVYALDVLSDYALRGQYRQSDPQSYQRLADWLQEEARDPRLQPDEDWDDPAAERDYVASLAVDRLSLFEDPAHVDFFLQRLEQASNNINEPRTAMSCLNALVIHGELIKQTPALRNRLLNTLVKVRSNAAGSWGSSSVGSDITRLMRHFDALLDDLDIYSGLIEDYSRQAGSGKAEQDAVAKDYQILSHLSKDLQAKVLMTSLDRNVAALSKLAIIGTPQGQRASRLVLQEFAPFALCDALVGALRESQQSHDAQELVNLIPVTDKLEKEYGNAMRAGAGFVEVDRRILIQEKPRLENNQYSQLRKNAIDQLIAFAVISSAAQRERVYQELVTLELGVLHTHLCAQASRVQGENALAPAEALQVVRYCANLYTGVLGGELGVESRSQLTDAMVQMFAYDNAQVRQVIASTLLPRDPAALLVACNRHWQVALTHQKASAAQYIDLWTQACQRCWDVDAETQQAVCQTACAEMARMLAIVGPREDRHGIRLHASAYLRSVAPDILIDGLKQAVSGEGGASYDKPAWALLCETFATCHEELSDVSIKATLQTFTSHSKSLDDVGALLAARVLLEWPGGKGVDTLRHLRSSLSPELHAGACRLIDVALASQESGEGDATSAETTDQPVEGSAQ